MTGNSPNGEEDHVVEIPPSPVSQTRGDQDSPPAMDLKSKNHLRTSPEAEIQKVPDSSRNAEPDGSTRTAPTASQQNLEQSTSRTIFYPLSSGLEENSTPGSSNRRSWHVPSSSSAQVLPPDKNYPYPSNQTPGLYLPPPKFSQAYSANQPSGLEFQDPSSSASSYSNLSIDPKYPHVIPSSQYYTPEVATPSGLLASVGPSSNPSQTLTHPPPLYSSGKPPAYAEQPIPYSKGGRLSNLESDSLEQQFSQLGLHTSSPSETGAPSYPPPAPPTDSTNSLSSGSLPKIPSVASYSEDPYGNAANSFSQRIHGQSPEVYSQYESNIDNPGPPGYPSRPNPSKTTMKSEFQAPGAPLPAVQSPTSIPRPSAGNGLYPPPKESKYNGETFGVKEQHISEPVKHTTPPFPNSKRPLAYVPKSDMSTSKPFIHAHSPNPAIADTEATSMALPGHHPPHSSASYSNQAQTSPYAYQEQVYATDSPSTQKLSRVQGENVEQSSYSAPPSELYNFGQYASMGEPAGTDASYQHPLVTSDSQTTSLPMHAGYMQPQHSSSGSYRPQPQHTKTVSEDWRINGRPARQYSSSSNAQTSYDDMYNNRFQTPNIPHPLSSPPEIPGPPSSTLDTGVSSSSLYNQTATVPICSVPTSSFQATDIPQYKASDVSHFRPDIRPQQKPVYGQPSIYDGSQYIPQHGSHGNLLSGEGYNPGYQTPQLQPSQQSQTPHGSKLYRPEGSLHGLQYGGQGEPSVGQSSEARPVADYQTPQLRPPQYSQPLLDMKPQQPESSAGNGPQYNVQNGYQGGPSVVQSSGLSTEYQTVQLRPPPPQQDQFPQELKFAPSGNPVYGQNPEMGQQISPVHGANVATMPYYAGEQVGMAQNPRTSSIPNIYNGAQPQHPHVYQASNGFLPISGQRPLPRNQIPNVQGQQSSVPSYGKAYGPQQYAIGHADTSVSQQPFHSSYYSGSPSMPKKFANQLVTSNQYERPPTVSGGLPHYDSSAGQRAYTGYQRHNPTQYQMPPGYPTANELQSGPLSYSAPGPPPGNFYGAVTPGAHGVAPQSSQYSGAICSYPPTNTFQQPPPPVAGLQQRPGMGWGGQTQGYVGATQPNDLYEQFMKVSNSMKSENIGNAGRR